MVDKPSVVDRTHDRTAAQPGRGDAFRYVAQAP